MDRRWGIAILDVGRTNKKLIVFDQDYRIVLEELETLPETTDEDGFACEDLSLLNQWLERSSKKISQIPNMAIRAINFSAYGASLVNITRDNQPWGPLYNYLKPYLPEWREQFVGRHGPMERISLETSSPDLGSLNSGMQLYRLATFHPEYRRFVRYSLHLPQYLCWYFSGRALSEITSVGCHTMLWDFSRGGYHPWVKEEQLHDYLAPLHPADRPVTSGANRKELLFGTGLHDSSAALLPYLRIGGEKFVVISTGTWSISLNPFNKEPLTIAELESDCLAYLTPYRDQVKASRFSAGPEHEKIIQRIRDHFHRFPDMDQIQFNKAWFHPEEPVQDIHAYHSAEQAYQNLMRNFVQQQKRSTDLVIGNSGIKKLYVDGGFSRNSIFMQLLAQAYPELDIYAATVPQASAIGAAMILESAWNSDPPTAEIVELRFIPRLCSL